MSWLCCGCCLSQERLSMSAVPQLLEFPSSLLAPALPTLCSENSEDSVNSKDMRKPDWQLRMIVCVCANLLLSFFESQGFSLHWNKVPRRPYKSGSQLWRFTHFLVRLHPHRFSFCFPNMLEPVNLGLSQEFCSCLPLYGILCHCPSLDFSVTQFLDPRSLPERSLPWPLRFKQS